LNIFGRNIFKTHRIVKVFPMKKLIFIILILAAIILLIIILVQKTRSTGKELKFAQNQETTCEWSGIPGFYLSHYTDTVFAAENYISSWRIHFVDVGQGDAILVQAAGKNILVDGGDRSSGITDYLKQINLDTLHWVIATHPHADHIAGLIPVFRSFPVIRVVDNGKSHNSGIYRTYRFLVDSVKADYTKGFAGWTADIADSFEIHVIHPDTIESFGTNDASLVLRMRLEDTYLLLTGDSEHKAEEAILSTGVNIRSHILKAGHHGSKTSSGRTFLQQVQPQTTIIMCAENNKYGFPHAEALHNIFYSGSQIYRTDHHGSILIVKDQNSYQVYHEKGESLQDHMHADLSFRININKATEKELTRIIHIGPATARQIIEKRPFGSIDDLSALRGIGEKKIEDIKAQGLATVGPEI
jgi:competence protein ComEC